MRKSVSMQVSNNTIEMLVLKKSISFYQFITMISFINRAIVTNIF